jgi:hypothetical protein
MKRPSWLPELTVTTAGQVLGSLIVLGIVLFFGRTRDAIADAARWLAHPVDTPRVFSVLLLALAAAAGRCS